MKLVIQRVKNASVSINNKVYSEIKTGILALVGIEKGDSEELAQKLAKKLVNLRIFPDENGKMNKSVIDINGEILIISQFTLCGNCKKGTRPSFDKSEKPEIANLLYKKYINFVENYEVSVKHGVFGADMQVSLLNDGPVTFILEEA